MPYISPDAVPRPCARTHLTASLAIAGALSLMLATAATAQNPFIIDGVVPANGQTPGATPFADPYGSVSELGPDNASNTKVGPIHTAAPPMLDFTNPNGQTDLRNVWMQTVTVGGDIWLYFAWERDAERGSGVIAFEFQRSGLPTGCNYSAAGIDQILPESAAETTLINSCNPWANRQAGDFLIVWDQSGSTINIILRTFVMSGGNLVLGPGTVLDSTVSAAAISTDGFRGEGAINLSDTVFPAAPTSCLTIGNIIPGTITGNSDTADYKDTLLAPFASFITISTCGSVKIVKATTPAAQTGSFPYTLARQGGAEINYNHDTSAAATLTSDGDFDIVADLIAATNYTLVEGALSSPWTLLSISCTTGSTTVNLTAGGTFAVEAGVQSVCTITNKRNQGSVTVIKHVVGGPLVATNFTMSLNDSSPATPSFAGHESPGDTFTFDAGHTYYVTESVASQYTGWYTASYAGDCGTSGSPIAIVADTTKTCTVTNTFVKAAPAGTTAQKVRIYDSISITGIRPGASDASSASVTFRLYSDNTCSTAVNSPIGPVALTYNAGPAPPAGTAATATTATGIEVLVGGTYYWRVQYTGDQFNTGFTTACGDESTQIVFTQ